MMMAAFLLFSFVWRRLCVSEGIVCVLMVVVFSGV